MASRTEIPSLTPHDAVIAVDVQRDFCPGGALPVERGDAVVPVLNAWIEAAVDAGATVVASRDWHPPDHVSFVDRGGPWPPHCVQDTPGAALHDDLRLPPDAILVSKGTHRDFDQYSTFDRTGLGSELRDRAIRRVWIGGLAQDVCVAATARHALAEGFETRVIVPATRPIDAVEGQRALDSLRAAGAELVGEEPRE